MWARRRRVGELCSGRTVTHDETFSAGHNGINLSNPMSSQTHDGGEQPANLSGVRVLIVEDNPHIVEMYSYVLKKLAASDFKGETPLEVHFAVDGHSALAMLGDSSFQLVMTDLYMPVMDGFQLLERMRATPALAEIPVAVISAGGADAREKAVKLGVNVFLKKPVRFAEVMDTVKQLLRLK
jgi:CheY-like chemotaxis protein